MPITEDRENRQGLQDAKPEPAKISRRKLLKTAAVGMPAVLTLHSGAALARSSNLIGIAPPGTRDLDGNALCLDTTMADSMDSTHVDIGDQADAAVNILADVPYYPESNRSKPPTNADMTCNMGGTHYYHDDGWHEVRLPTNGVIVSATAIVSVSLRGNILFNRIS